ncbi:MAG TPA: methyltransferase domain-containing protein [Ktedonobacteraceae bacterium]|nr:methyltransferase domain-containing protein [Ktedonobacteraceae bacterium]
MKHTSAELATRLTLDSFPRSASYDAVWMLENVMGPNPLWLAEALSQVMDLQPGMRVMDLGCGRATSSIFLAREFQLRVWATDLWISASDNWKRICAANAQQQVFPIHAEAHALPFANGFFDAIVSLDAYHYFGTDDLYIGYISQFVRPGGTIGIVVPGVLHELNGQLPDHLASRWPWDWWSFHSPSWWRRHWEKTGLVDVEVADTIPEGWQHWLKWLEVCMEEGYPSSQDEVDILRLDAGRTLGFTRVVGRRSRVRKYS